LLTTRPILTYKTFNKQELNKFIESKNQKDWHKQDAIFKCQESANRIDSLLTSENYKISEFQMEFYGYDNFLES